MEAPSSPGTELRDCVEELLKFTLQSHVSQTLGLDFELGISTDYCSALLKEEEEEGGGDDPNASPSASALYMMLSGSFQGVPHYPLYRRLAMTLSEAIYSGTLCKKDKEATLLDEDKTPINQIGELDELIQQRGTELLNILKAINFQIHVQEPFFTQLKDGLKTVEGRCATGDYNRIAPGALILVNKCLVLEVQDVRKYASFLEMLEVEGLSKVLPGVSSIVEGVQIYRRFYTEEKERSNGVLAIDVRRSTPQPYFSVARILSELSCSGVQRLLGLVHTAGTISDSLPPPRSALLSAFQLPYNPDVKGSSLTDGARSLAKHFSRSSSKYWGSFDGSDLNKNKAALDIINCLISSCCWLNLHVVPPDGVVFEIRDANGYGARWSRDGTKFIGFLEPYMKDGHSRRWRH